MMKKQLLFLLITLSIKSVTAQGFLHTSGKFIYDGNNQEVILRGIGTGNWMIQEGYMMQSSDVAGTQHEFRAQLTSTIGEANTDSFYNAWLANQFTRTDVDSMKAWGFNSVRVAMHYVWFTLPIEDELVEGQNTWINKGFNMIDSLLDWCSDNEMYLILDLHGAPGGQGKDANISDYDPSKPSLWESALNKNKTIALWQKLAERYANSPWIGGYDLINETNWTFPEGNNSQMRSLFGAITTAIREVDDNHIIFIEGNSFANDHSGLTPPWDNNMVYSFHKYWNYNTINEINFAINLRNTQNVPIWLGETGENSNTWFTNLIRLCEDNKIGWSWWPVKKPGINNPLMVEVNEDYTALINDWKGTGPSLTAEEAFQAVLGFAENQKIENCSYQKDVVDAMIRQPYSYESKPFVSKTVNETLFFTDYDLGRNNVAYFDSDTANYHLSQNGTYTNWNQGWAYRNDGVDIQVCTDTAENNGYNVGWTVDGEWMQYTISSDTAAGYTVSIRSACGASKGSTLHFEVNNVAVTGKINLPVTGSWTNWATTQVDDVILPAGTFKIKLVIEKGGSNLNYVKFSEAQSVNNIEFKPISAVTSPSEEAINLVVNKAITSIAESIDKNEFSILVDDQPYEISNIELNENDPKILTLTPLSPIYYGQKITIDYNGQSVTSNEELLENFTNLEVANLLPARYTLPAKIQAEDFYFNYGLQLETCTDVGGGQNTGFANAGDYLDYLIHVPESGEYLINLRVATTARNAQIVLQSNSTGQFISLDTVSIMNTSGWQKWKNQSTLIHLDEGRYTFRIFIKQGEHNLNWFEISVNTAITNPTDKNKIVLYPNPTKNYLNIQLPFAEQSEVKIELINLYGQLVYTYKTHETTPVHFNLPILPTGFYQVKVQTNEFEYNLKMLEIM